VLPEPLAQAAHESLSSADFLDLVLVELERGGQRRVATMLTLSGLPSGKRRSRKRRSRTSAQNNDTVGASRLC
jgi:hypothetical protein